MSRANVWRGAATADIDCWRRARARVLLTLTRARARRRLEISEKDRAQAVTFIVERLDAPMRDPERAADIAEDIIDKVLSTAASREKQDQ